MFLLKITTSSYPTEWKVTSLLVVVSRMLFTKQDLTIEEAGGVGALSIHSQWYNLPHKRWSQLKHWWIRNSLGRNSNYVQQKYPHWHYLQTSNVDAFLNKIYSNIDIVNKESKLCALLGDFNVYRLDFEIHKPIEEFVNTMSTNFFEPHIVNPTEITHHMHCHFDGQYIFKLNWFSYWAVSSNVVYDLSYYLPNFLRIIMNWIFRLTQKMIFVRDFSKLNEDSVLYINDLAAIQGQNVLSET